MSEIKFKVSKDGNEKKYIPLIRKMLRYRYMQSGKHRGAAAYERAH